MTIIENVREKTETKQSFAYTEQFDGAKIDASNILVTEEEIAGSL